MGISLAPGNGYVGGSAGSAVGGGAFNMKTGVATAIQSLMTVGPDGLGYPAQTSDYAAKPSIYDYPVAATTVGPSNAAHYERMNVLQMPNGDIIIADCGNGVNGYGMWAYRYNASGALMNTVAIDDFYAVNYGPQMAMLSNGNLVVTYSDGTNLRFSILSQSLAIIKAPTTIDGITSNQIHNMIAPSSGGFVVSWQDKNTMTNYNLAAYDNGGTVVTAKNVIRAVGNGPVYCRTVQLSNGNIAMVIQNTATSFIGVLSAVGVVVVAFVSGDAIGYSGLDVSAVAGYFAVVGKDSATAFLKLRVYSNAGVQQGATVALDCFSASLHAARLINDGTDFWISYTPAQSKQGLSRVTTAAVVTTWTNMVVVGNRLAKSTYDMFYERGRLIIIMVDPTDSGNSFVLTVFNTVTLVQESTSFSALGTMAVGLYTRMIPGGDFTAIILGMNGSNALSFGVIKYTSASVIGVATGAAVKGGIVSIAALSGTYGINSLRGTSAKSFDHSAAPIPGNKGTILNYGAVLKGF